MRTDWEEIDLPALRQIRSWEGEDDWFTYDTRDVANALGIDDVDRVGRQLEALQEKGLITMGNGKTSGNVHNYLTLRLTTAGRKHAGD